MKLQIRPIAHGNTPVAQCAPRVETSGRLEIATRLDLVEAPVVKETLIKQLRNRKRHIHVHTLSLRPDEADDSSNGPAWIHADLRCS
eukprot:199445-Prymnesium_polylepis.1